MPVFVEYALIVLAVVVFVAIFAPPVIAFYLYFFDRKQRQHSILRSYPILGRLRYLFESVGPEMRQYFFDEDNDGKPFSRVQFAEVVKSSKYLERLIGFGSKRDFEKAGFYLRNSMFPTLNADLRVDNGARVPTRRYVTDEEGLFSRKEHSEEFEAEPWLLAEDDAVVIGTCGFAQESRPVMIEVALQDHQPLLELVAIHVVARRTFVRTEQNGHRLNVLRPHGGEKFLDG